MTCSCFVLQQVRQVVEYCCLLRTARLYLLIPLQRSLVPSFGLGGATSFRCDIGKLVAGLSYTCCTAHSLFQGQAFTVAVLGFCPLFPFLCNHAQLMPGNRLHCRLTQGMEGVKR